MATRRTRALTLLAAAAAGFLAALVVPRSRWRSRPIELPAGPWPPLPPDPGGPPDEDAAGG